MRAGSNEPRKSVISCSTEGTGDDEVDSRDLSELVLLQDAATTVTTKERQTATIEVTLKLRPSTITPCPKQNIVDAPPYCLAFSHQRIRQGGPRRDHPACGFVLTRYSGLIEGRRQTARNGIDQGNRVQFHRRPAKRDPHDPRAQLVVHLLLLQ